MSERYNTRRSFAVMVSNLLKAHSSLVVPGEVQPACRGGGPAAQTAVVRQKRGSGRVVGRRIGGAAGRRLPAINIRCRVAATSVLLAVTPVLARQQPVRPETPADRPETPPAGVAPPASSPREPGVLEPAGTDADGAIPPQRALSVFETVRGWIDQGRVPETPVADLPPSWISTVVIRRGGRIIGRETTIAQDAGDASLTIQRAASRALRRAVARLEGEPDALRSRRVRDGLLASRLTIELTPRRAVPVPADAGRANLDDWVRSGVEGMLVRHGADVAASTPGLMLALGRTPSNTFVTLVSQLADDPSKALQPADELFAQGFALSLFNTVQVAQIEPGGAPLILHRGGRIAPPVRSTADLRALADSIASHLMSRAWPGVERLGLRGTYDPLTGRFDDRPASPFDQAFAAEALLRYARAPGIDAERAAGAISTAQATLAALSVVEPSERAPWGDAVSASACLSALNRLDKLEVERSGELRALRDRCLEQVRGAYDAKNGFDPMIPAGARGVVARGLIASAAFEPWDRDERLLLADGAIRAAFRDVPPTQLLGLMPDLGWAEIELAREMGVAPPAARALVSLRRSVLSLKLKPGDLLPVDRDLAGGLVLDAAGSPLPTWQTLRPLGLLAMMLGDEHLTPGTIGTGDAPRQLIEVLDVSRFLMQLTAEARLGHMYADPGMALGGVRASLWDQHMPLAASAVGLSAVCETLDSLERISGRRPPTAGTP